MSDFDWNKYEKAPETKGFDWDKYQTVEDALQEQQGMAAATMAADRKFEAEDYSELESAVGGLSKGFSFGLGDESAGASKALRDTIFGDKKIKDIVKNYVISRDLARKKYKDMEAANPKSFIGGEIGGGAVHMANPLFNAAKGAQLGKQLGTLAAEGGAYGYGTSDEESAIGQIKDTGKGAAMAITGGGLARGAGKVLGPVARKTGEVLGPVGRGAKAVGRGIAQVPGSIGRSPQSLWRSKRTFIEGAGNEKLKSLPDAAKTVAGVWEVMKSFADTAARKQEFKKLVSGERAINFKGTDQEFVLDQLITDGPNPIKDWIAERSTTLLPGQLDTKLVKDILDLSMDSRVTARKFDKKGAGEALLPKVTEAYKTTKQASGEAFERLHKEASEIFENVGDTPIEILDKHLTYAASKESISGSTGAILRDVKNGLGEDFAYISPQEQFKRLQAARVELDAGVGWGVKNELPEGQKVLLKARSDFNDLLKVSDQKLEADALYSTFKDFKDDFFEKMAGKIEHGDIKDFDDIKIEKLFTEHDSGRRLYKQINKAKKALLDGKLSTDDANTLRKVLGEIEEIKGIADSKRAIDAFRYKGGPTSPAVERQAAAMGDSKPLTEAINSPSSFIATMDQFFPAESRKRFGKELSNLSEEERLQIQRLWTWKKKNIEAYPAATEKAWEAIRKRKK